VCEEALVPLDATLGTLLGAAVGSLTGVATSLITTSRSGKQARETRENERKRDSKKWQREEVARSLAESIKFINLYITSALPKKDNLEAMQNDPECRGNSAAAQAAMAALALSYPDKNGEDYKSFVKKLDETMFQGVPYVRQVWDVRQLIVRLASKAGSIAE
jgi:gas vesicle protein